MGLATEKLASRLCGALGICVLAPLLLGAAGAGGASEIREIAADLQPHYFARRPWIAWDQRWPASPSLKLGRYGREAALDWRRELENAKARLLQITHETLPPLARAEYRALHAWIETQLILLDSRPLERTDATLYVEHVDQTRRSLARAEWISAERRRGLTQELNEGIPAFWAEAKQSLITPSSEWLAEALEDLADLERRMKRVEGALERARMNAAGLGASLKKALAATRDFQRWVCDKQKTSRHSTPRMSEQSWTELVRHASGSVLSAPELKALLLRDLADLDGVGCPGDPLTRSAYSRESTRELIVTSSGALADLLQDVPFVRRLKIPPRLEVDFHNALVEPHEQFRLAPEAVSWRLFLEVPSRAWPIPMQSTRLAMYQGSSPRLLGVRYGQGGEAWMRSQFSRTGKPSTAYLWNRSVLEGFGLWTLDWAPRLESTGNTFSGDANLTADCGWAMKLEIARLLAALELHAEDLSVEEEVVSFQRRTGLDATSALTEVRLAQHDPLHGIGYLGFLELRALESEAATILPGQLALTGTLYFSLSFPNLRPVDVKVAVQGALARKIGKSRMMSLTKNMLGR
jgi:hypothetical protein